MPISSLTDYEMQLVSDPRMLITKNLIIKKVSAFFAKLSEEYKKELPLDLMEENFISPKISRGENYLGLPYVVLDYPRQFGKTDVLAVRTFFWWGNFFSITLQLAGKYHQQFYANIKNAIQKDRFEQWYIGVGTNQWEHHFESDNYLPLTSEKKYDLAANDFLKLAKKIPLDKWDETDVFCIENFKLIMTVLQSKPQYGEIDLLPGTPTTGSGL